MATRRSAVARALGVALVALGGLTAVFFGLSLPSSSGSSQLAGGIVLTLGGLLVAGAGYLLLRVGSRSVGARPGVWLRQSVRRHLLVLMYTGFGLLAVVFAVAGVAILLDGGGAAGGGGVFLAFVPVFLGGVALLEVARRGGGRTAQWIAVSSGFVVAGVILLVLGLTGEDARKLALYGVVSLAAASGGTARAVARRGGS